MDIITLTKKLLSFNNINPPGNEEGIARYTAALLSENGFEIRLKEFDKGRLHLIAEKGLSTHKHPVVLSGHFDTVPLGNNKWSVDPFGGELSEGKIWGRGSSDMKGGVAAMILAAIDAFKNRAPEGGVRLIFTAAEELGCIGIQQLMKTIDNPGSASAVIVGEPTGNIPAIGHKGAIYLNAVTSGKTAHSSMPHLGDNAIYKAAESILKARDFKFETEADPLLGFPTINVGKMSGGLNLNSVPDHAEFTIDIRSTSKTDHNKTIARLSEELGNETKLEVLVDMTPVFTPEDNPFVRMVYEICGIDINKAGFPKSLPYLTDGSVLQKTYGGIPTIILGPGEAEMAHKTDEFCYINKLEESYRIYKDIILTWRNYIC
ncbi:MAG TPA: M20 family metallopeptidase [Bacteroidales bacterium]|nr:M20 family metallopeptidase [Bacteroidales bacterium]